MYVKKTLIVVYLRGEARRGAARGSRAAVPTVGGALHSTLTVGPTNPLQCDAQSHKPSLYLTADLLLPHKDNPSNSCLYCRLPSAPSRTPVPLPAIQYTTYSIALLPLRVCGRIVVTRNNVSLWSIVTVSLKPSVLLSLLLFV